MFETIFEKFEKADCLKCSSCEGLVSAVMSGVGGLIKLSFWRILEEVKNDHKQRMSFLCLSAVCQVCDMKEMVSIKKVFSKLQK